MSNQLAHSVATSVKKTQLTTRQQEIFSLIQRVITQTGAPPTRAEIATELGFRSANAAEEHLQALARKGAIELIGGTARGIRVRNAYLKDSSHGWKLPPDATPDASFDAMEFFNGAATTSPKSFALPLIGRVAAGNPILAQEHIDRMYTIERHFFEQQPDFLLRVRGLSMQGAGIMDGDLLAVKKSSEAINGQIIVARLGDEVTVKRYFRRSHGKIELVPENPDFQTLVVAANQPFAIEGLAVGLIRNNFN